MGWMGPVHLRVMSWSIITRSNGSFFFFFLSSRRCQLKRGKNSHPALALSWAFIQTVPSSEAPWVSSTWPVLYFLPEHSDSVFLWNLKSVIVSTVASTCPSLSGQVEMYSFGLTIAPLRVSSFWPGIVTCHLYSPQNEPSAHQLVSLNKHCLRERLSFPTLSPDKYWLQSAYP